MSEDLKKFLNVIELDGVEMFHFENKSELKSVVVANSSIHEITSVQSEIGWRHDTLKDGVHQETSHDFSCGPSPLSHQLEVMSLLLSL